MWVFDLIGSLGLFLLGMWLMTEGLKLAGGNALQNLLGRWTSSRIRGLASGILVTAMVQSSSAVTVAAIGFVNAGLMAFQQSIWVIFGSNVGTTLTAWLVTLFGFSIDIEAFTFPLFGLGAMLRVMTPYKRVQATGMALAGFGLLFMGIDALQVTFGGLAESIDFATFASTGISSVLLGFVIGAILTVITQSSSAAIALILTAVASGLVDLNLATAAVVGANVGTTSTALIATIAATANAKRLAYAHVTFNIITAIVALLLMPIFLRFSSLIVNPDSTANMTLFLAVFHTSFNLMGVILMVPVEPWLSKRLQQMFSKEKPGRRTKSTLDKNVATVPDLAVRALAIELKELQHQIGKIALDKLVRKEQEFQLDEESSELASLDNLRQRLDGVGQFISLISQSDLTEQLSDRLTAGFSASHYLHNCHETLSGIIAQKEKVAEMDSYVFSLLDAWLKEVTAFATDIAHTDIEYRQSHWSEMLGIYQTFKHDALSATVNRGIDMASVETALFIGSMSRRYVDQLIQLNENYDLLLHPVDRNEGDQVAEKPKDEDADEVTESGDVEDAEEIID